MAERFFVADQLAPGPYTLTGPEAHHLTHVCRVRAGAKVVLFNGDGHEYPAAVIRTSRTEAELDVFAHRLVDRELPFPLIVACPLPKGDRCQFLLEKLTELGATAFVPLETERTVVHPGEGKVEKLRRYVIESAKQCGRNRLMEIKTPEKWSSFAQNADVSTMRCLADPTGKPLSFSPRPGTPGRGVGGEGPVFDGCEPLTPNPSPRSTGARGVIVAIGPEGGWSEKELTSGDEAGWLKVCLGPRILRMETAAIAVVAALSIDN